MGKPRTKRKPEPRSRFAHSPSQRSLAGERSGSLLRFSPVAAVIMAWASRKWTSGMGCGTLGNSRPRRATAPAASRSMPASMLAMVSVSTAMTVYSFSMNPTSASRETYSLMWRGGWWGAARHPGAHLVDALKDAHHHLLGELRALGQVGGLAEVVEGEGGGSRLGRRADDLRGLDLGETEIVQAAAETGHGGSLDGE